MTSRWSRFLAMGCSAAALACVAAWLYLGADVPPTWDAEAVNPKTTPYMIEIWTDRAELPVTLERLKAKGYTASVVAGDYDQYTHMILLLDREFSHEQLRAVYADVGWIAGRHFMGPGPVSWERTLFYMKLGRDGASRALVFDVAQQSRSAVRIIVGMLLASVLAAACLALLMLARSDRPPFIRDLGTGMGLWSLSFCYLWIFSTLPGFDRYRSSALGWGMLADAIAFLLLIAANRTFRHFWDAYPRPVSAQELDGFLDSLFRKQSAGLGPLRRLAARLFAQGPTGSSSPWQRDLGGRVSLLGCLTLLLFLWLSVMWRISLMNTDKLHEYFDISGPWSVLALLAYMALLYWPGIHCLRLFKFHRMLGSPEERRKIEWIQAALWMGVVAFVVPAAGLAVLSVGSRFFPELDFALSWCTLYLVIGLFAGPLLVLLAVALSTLYRGSLDPQLALRGFTVWTVLGVLLTLAFVLIERSVALKLARWWDLSPQTGYVTAGAVVAATFQPLRKYAEKNVTRFVERVLPETLLVSGTRHPAAVAVVDISGYTAMTARDEKSALIASAAVQKEAQRVAERCGGRVVKSTGDGVILCFVTPGSAIEAVLAIHAGVRSRAAALELPLLKLHSGLHCGEVVEMRDGDIYGQTVNLAARIADWAQAGEIGMSEAFAAALPTPAVGFEPQGPQRFKNVPEPIVCLKHGLA